MQTVGWKQVLSNKLWHGEYSTRASDGLFLLFASCFHNERMEKRDYRINYNLAH